MKERDPEFRSRVQRSFDRQALMKTLGARLVRVEPGEVTIELPFRDDLTQQHEFVHGGALASVGDSACGYAAFSLMPPGVGVLGVEFKINFVAPAAGKSFEARAKVVREGRTLTVAACDVVARTAEGEETVVATMLATIMTIRHRPEIVD